MCDVPVFYATTEGQTHRIAERFAEQVRQHGLDSRAVNLAAPNDVSAIDWTRVRGACVAASLHRGRHQPEAVAFARRYSRELSLIPSLFISVSLAAASKNPAEVRDAEKLAHEFPMTSGWTPWRVAAIAGRLAYTRYNFAVRWLMRRIAIKEGASGDTSCDHEYTDWAQVTGLADRLAYQIRRRDLYPIHHGAIAKAG